MIAEEDAKLTAKALTEAAATVAVRQLRYELRRRAREWGRAVDELDMAGDDGVIELVGSIGAGMLALGNMGHDEVWWPIVRAFPSNGGWSLHLEDPAGRAVYRNLAGATSPVVVQA